jgi:hypothetical protein
MMLLPALSPVFDVALANVTVAVLELFVFAVAIHAHCQEIPSVSVWEVIAVALAQGPDVTDALSPEDEV